MNTKQIARAFAQSKPAKAGNVRVGPTEHGFGYWLHGHLIAERIGQSLNLNWCDWYTGTTARHMNAVCDALQANYRVSYAKARDASIVSEGTTF